MKISIFLLHLAHGGVEKASTELSNALIKRGHQVKLYVSYNLGEPVYVLDSKVEVEYLTVCRPNRAEFKEALRAKNPLRILREAVSAVRTLSAKKTSLNKALRQLTDGVVICTRHEQNLELAKLKTPGLFKIAWLHHDIEPESKRYNQIMRSYSGVDVVTTLTDELRLELEEGYAKHASDLPKKSRIKHDLSAPQFVWMPNFLEDKIFSQAALDPINSVAKSQGGKLISVSRFEHEKGIDRLVEIWATLAKDYPDWSLELIGDGSQMEAIKALASQHNLSNQLQLTGMLPYEDVLAHFQAADIYVMPSRSEGFGLVLLEAAVMGLPLLAFDVRSGPRSIIRQGVNGFLVEDGDGLGFANTCRNLMDDEDLRKKMGEKARLMAQTFSETEIMKRWDAVLEQAQEPIPKKIHYVWVGGAPKSKLIARCIRSWQNHLSTYEIIEWNESNFDIDAHPYVKEAYRRKKWAFVSDYIRAWALYHEGGIYLDTDNVVLAPLDSFRRHRAFVGFERPDYPFTACFGCEKGHPLVKDIMDFYDNQAFELDEENPLPFNNTISVSNLLMEKYGALGNNQRQDLAEGIALYPDTVLCNPDRASRVIHVFTGTWLGKKSRLRQLVTGLKSYVNTPWKASLYASLFRRKDGAEQGLNSSK